MGYRPQAKFSRSGRGHQKIERERAKARKQKHLPSDRTAAGSAAPFSKEQVAEKTLKSLRGLGNQRFALSPFSQYFDDWLINLREVLSVFESTPLLNVDESYVAERSRIMTRIEGELVKRRRLEEAELKERWKVRSEKNHLLTKIDTDYAADTRELKVKRNAEIDNLTKTVNGLERQLDEIGKVKTGLFNVLVKREKAQKEKETAAKLGSAKKELEKAVQNFTVEQEKLHGEYEKKKQKTIEEAQLLEKEIEKLEIDNSQQHRQTACEALVEAISAFLERAKQTD